MRKYNLLYVEDDIEIIDDVLYFIKKKFKNIYIANDGKEAFELYNNHDIDLLLLDINIPYINGLQLAEMIRKTNPDIPILFLTAFSDKNKLLKAIDLQVHGYILKPLKIDELTISLNKMIALIDKKNELIDIVSFTNGFSWHKFLEELKYFDTIIPLTKNEVSFINIMLDQKCKPLSFDEIKDNLFEGSEIKDNSIVQLVARLKKKVKNISGSDDFFIENIYQYGYKLNIDTQGWDEIK